MSGRYRIKVSGKADTALVPWLERLIWLLRSMPPGWRAELVLERDEDA